MDKEKVQIEMLKRNCDWFETKLNVPSASHMGGVWEPQIRTVRSVLSALLETNRRQLNDEVLRTFMCEAEAVVKIRPLTADNLTSVDNVEAPHSKSFVNGKEQINTPRSGGDACSTLLTSFGAVGNGSFCSPFKHVRNGSA